MSDQNEGRMQRIKQDDSAGESWWRRLPSFLLLVVQDFGADNGPQWAAAISYYVLLSLFPLLLAIASIASFFADPEATVDVATDLLGEFLPMGEEEIEDIVQGAFEARGTVGLFSIASLLWTGTRAFSALTMAMNIVFDVDEPYSFIKRTLIDLIMLLTLGLLFALFLVSGPVFTLAFRALEILPADPGILIQIAIWLVPGVILFIALLLAYRFVPRREVSWRAAWPGTLAATLVILAARPIFGYYVEQFGQYHEIYGPIAVIIILIFWAWIVATIIILGGEIVSHTQMMFIEGMSAQEIQQRHLARSPTRNKNARAKEEDDGKEREQDRADS
jgi:membrane protein